MSGKSHIHFQAFTATRVSASLFYSLFSIAVFSPFNLFRSADFFLPLHSNVFTPLSTEQFFPSQHFPICLFCLCLSLSLFFHLFCSLHAFLHTRHVKWTSHEWPHMIRLAIRTSPPAWAKAHCCVFVSNRAMENRGRLREFGGIRMTT